VNKKKVFESNFGDKFLMEEEKKKKKGKKSSSSSSFSSSSAYWLVYIQTIFIPKIMFLSDEFSHLL
jgi:hypothetical protein